MSKVTMPEPVAFRWRVPIVDSEGRQCGESDWKFGTEKGSLPWWAHDSLITTIQAEAYAAAKVREALEEAERQCRERADEYLSRKLRWQHHQGAGLGASICADAIRAMIDNQ